MENRGKLIVVDGADKIGKTAILKKFINLTKQSFIVISETTSDSNDCVMFSHNINRYEILNSEEYKNFIYSRVSILKTFKELQSSKESVLETYVVSAIRYYCYEFVELILNKGINVIMDRYWTSTLVYQGMIKDKRNWDLCWILSCITTHYQNIDCFILVTSDYHFIKKHILADKLSGLRLDIYDDSGENFFNQVQNSFIELYENWNKLIGKNYPKYRINVTENNYDFLSELEYILKEF